ncbi:hypothetical protein [Dyadobacter sp. CY323]|uniref:hypothetical protein n=1 Tax=Dyadobacter sp. CY323 TaxID=2907302 RepID=UPI001F3A23BC|nr:hypothetical protein [Dyadobacter sp. CY323]MCE6993079.1 hypothetical protein [Dyadobacter sp. CY323]
MKTIIPILLLLATISSAQTIQPPLGLSFGMSKESFNTAMKSKKAGRKFEYDHKNTTGFEAVEYDDVEIGTQTANKFKAEFFQSKLAVVEVTFYNIYDKTYLLNTLQEKYGAPARGKTQDNAEYSVWQDNSQKISLYIVPSKVGKGDIYVIYYEDKSLVALASVYVKNKSKNDF